MDEIAPPLHLNGVRRDALGPDEEVHLHGGRCNPHLIERASGDGAGRQTVVNLPLGTAFGHVKAGWWECGVYLHVCAPNGLVSLRTGGGKGRNQGRP